MKWNESLRVGLAGLTRKERWVHGVLWCLGLLILNWPGQQITVGPFHSDEYGLLFPSLYGGVINAVMVYGIIGFFLLHGKPFRFSLFYQSLLFYVTVSFVESLVDGTYYQGVINELNQVVISEIWQGNLIMNFFMFYVPALVYGIVKSAMVSEMPNQRIIVHDGHQMVYLEPNELLYLESDGNYVKYHQEEKTIMERSTLKQAEDGLPDQFIRCHKSFIINRDLVDQRSANEVVIKGNRIPIGRKYKENLSL
ncbi:MAG: LytTR family DNA-binding domain-containing protein [Cytophagales bacterium]|nr:LytTR family DNA-binding domain-containing protein [Cytophagales bacterium]